MELFVGRRLPVVGLIQRNYFDTEIEHPPDVDIFAIAGSSGPIQTVVPALARLRRPVAYSYGDLDPLRASADRHLARELVKGTTVHLMDEGSTINVLGTEFSGSESINEMRFASTSAVDRDITLNRPDCYSKHCLGDKHAGFGYLNTQSARPLGKTHWIECSDQTLAKESGPSVLVSHARPTRHGSPDLVDRLSARLASIGAMLRKQRDLAPRPAGGLPGNGEPSVTPWIHFHSTGVDVSDQRSIAPLAGEHERNCLVDRVIKAQSVVPAGRSPITVVSLAEAFFSVPLRTSADQLEEDQNHEVIYLEPAIASWCGAVCRAREMLAGQSLRFAIETFPLDWLAGRNVMVVGVLVERISDERAKKIRRSLNELRVPGNRTPLYFDVIPVKSLGRNMGSVQTLSKDAFDAAFEAIRH